MKKPSHAFDEEQGEVACGPPITLPSPPSADPVAPPSGLARLLEIQRDLAIQLLHCTDLPDCLETLLTAALRLPGFDCGGVYLCDNTVGGLRLVAHRGLSEEFVQRATRHWADSPQDRVVRAGELVYCLRGELPEPIAETLAAEGLEAIAVLPLRANGMVVASLNLSSHCYPRIQPESRTALESLTALAEGTIELIQQRDARQSAERQLRLAVESAGLGAWSLDLDTETFEASARFRELHGLGADEPLSLAAIRAAIHPADLAAVEAITWQAVREETPLDCSYRTRDGSRWLTSVARCYPDHGRHLHGIVRDITARKQMEEALRDSLIQLEAKVAGRTAELAAANAALRQESRNLELALIASDAGTWSLDVATGSVQWDRRSREIYGVTDEVPVTSKLCMDYRVHPADQEPLLRHVAEIVAAGQDRAWSHEFRVLHPTLGERWVQSLGRVERDASGQPVRMAGINLDITERKLSEHLLRQSEEKYRLLHQSMHEAFVVTDMTGRILEFNQAYQDMLGYTPEELSRMTYVDLTPDRWHAFEDRPLETQILQRDYSEVYEKEYRRKDGTLVPVELRTFLIRDVAGTPHSMWAIVRNITERKATEEITRQWHQTLERRLGERSQQLLQSEARFRQLAEATFEGIVISEGGIVLDANPQIAAMFGCELTEIIGRSLADFVPPESRDRFSERLRDNREEPYEWMAMRKDGSRFPVQANPRIRIWNDRTVRITALRDLTETKLAAAKIQAQRRELEQAHQLALISEISAGIIHQIGQPVTALGINLAVLSRQLETGDIQPGPARQIVGELAADLTRIREIVVHLRSLANPTHPTRVQTDLHTAIADVLPLLHREAEGRQIRLETALEPNLPPLLADAVQLKQVVLNLVRNGFDACADCPPPRRTVSITTRTIPDQGIELTVRDAGTGITPEAAEHLFAPFYTNKPGGLGIGLRLSRTIVQAHDGTLEVLNNPDGIGARFRVLLPAGSDPIIPKYNYPAEPESDTLPE